MSGEEPSTRQATFNSQLATSNSVCHICGERADAGNSTVCNNCHRSFHLRLRNDAEGRDCGEVWINEQYLSLEFACFECLGVRPPAGQLAAEPPVGGGH